MANIIAVSESPQRTPLWAYLLYLDGYAYPFPRPYFRNL